MRQESTIAQVGTRTDPQTGAVSPPIYHAATYQHPGFGQSTGYDYTRTANPTRVILEREIAKLEGGTHGFSFSSGMAAVANVLSLLNQNDHLIASDDLYGGTYRIVEQLFRRFGVDASYVDTSDTQAISNAIRPESKAIFIETPTNPMMKISDIREIAQIAREHNLLLIVDNTFMTPYCQQPLALGADIVLHSATKYLSGHNDVLAGLVVTGKPDLAERIAFIQNSVGAVLGPQDCWLTMRGMKTLALRMERQQENALAVATWLTTHKNVRAVYYPGLAEHTGRFVHQQQSNGFGGMLSFTVDSEQRVIQVLEKIAMVIFAESLGGLESMITFPARQTHADIPIEIRERQGITNTLLRMSVGIEHIDDIIADLDQALCDSI